MQRVMILLLAAVALAGCGDSGPELSTEGGHTHGEIYVCPDGTRIDPGDFGDHHSSDFDAQSKCPAPEAPASTSLALARAAATAYDSIDVVWDAVPANNGDHVMHTGIHWSLDGGEPGIGPETWGELIDERTHQPAPGQFTATFTPEEPGTYTLRSFAQTKNNGPYIWSEPATLSVAEIAPTGEEEVISIDFGLPTSQLSDANVQIRAGDGIVFVNNDLRAQELHTTDGPQSFETGELASGGGTSDTIVLFRVGNYDYSNGDGTLSGRITVLAPSSA